MAARKYTNLELVKRVDSFPHEDKEPEKYAEMMENIAVFTWKDPAGNDVPLGYALKHVFERIKQTPEEFRGEMVEKPIAGPSTSFSLFFNGVTEQERTKKAITLTEHLRDEKAFTLLSGWRNELWPCYGPDGKETLFSMERCSIGLLGLNRYGVHMMAYIKDDSVPYGMKLWIPRRARNKKTWPGMLDNTVAGGLMTNEDPFDCIVREADEEASLPEAVVRGSAKPAGTVTFVYLTGSGAGGENGYVYPECQFLFDLELPTGIVPTPKDGEVEEFLLMTVDETMACLANGEFKANCGLVMIDFFVRHGIVTKENEPDFDKIYRHMHRKLPFPGPQQAYEK
ncbi:uncharacterized protein MKZ38_001164 [Zalerion maritima]|uniref:Nudix hydrolase domain-containing protein n=1 Tax=Zalerion maritima TaxID=339359 RepID=A0AAD5WRM9_9PEZI|nr:uncharacterized protein MKZ38_001164 [Zalerion maritima]